MSGGDCVLRESPEDIAGGITVSTAYRHQA